MMRQLRRGGFHYNFIGRARLWFILSGVVVVVSVASLAVREINLGLEFRGGTAFEFQSRNRDLTVSDVRSVLEDAGVENETVQEVGTNGFLIQSEHLPEETQNRVLRALAEAGDIDRNDINVTDVGPKWGAQITRKALQALGYFLLVVILYLSIRLEPKMAVAAVIAVLHDLVATAGIYSLTGFEVTPSTVIALLTILGYSLYDTVVIFDRIKERTANLSAAGRITYSQAANEALNQVFTRSISTSVVSLLPVGSLLFVGSILLGAQTLRELALALFVGMAVSAYSSTFTAAPILALWKEREPRWKTLRTRINARGAVDAPVPPPPPPPPPTQPARSTAGQTAVDSPPRPASSPTGGGGNRTRRRKKRKRRRR
jgi:preprotein translocase subunit SecF